MPTSISAPPTTARVEIAVGTVLAFVGALVLVTRIGSIPGFIVELVVGFASVQGFWPMVGGALLLAIGIALIVRGRHGVRDHRSFVARVEAARAREEERRQQFGLTAGSTHRMPKQP